MAAPLSPSRADLETLPTGASSVATIVSAIGARAAAVIAWAEASHARAVAVLVAIALLSFLPGVFAVPPTDRDESRFAQASRQMVETGNYVDIRLQEEARHKKPIGIYWLQAAAVHLSGYGASAPIAVYRMPSVLGAILAVVLTYWAMLPLMSRRAAFLAALMTGSTILLGVEARIAKTDAVMLATVVAAMGALVRVFLDPEAWRRTSVPWIFWAAIGVGILIKGPITLMVAALAAAFLAAWSRSWRWLLALRPGWGAVLALGIAAPWLVAITIETGGSFFRDSVGADMIGKVGESAERHGGPPGYHAILFWFIGWPMGAFVALSLPWLWRNRARREIVVLVAWALPTWLVFEAISTKLPHYVLPVYPAIAGLAALALVDGAIVAKRLWERVLVAGLWLLPLAVVLVAIGALAWIEGRVSPGLVVAGALAIALGLAASLVARASMQAAVPVAALATIALSTALLQFALPGFSTLWLSSRMAEAVRATATCEAPRLATAAYHEPSLVFLTRTDTMIANGEMAAEFLGGGGCRMAFVDAAPDGPGAASQEEVFRRRIGELGIRVEQVAMVEGRNFNGGRIRRMGLWRLTAPR
jgi:4-amino-4-deoxy-L-arabinose transferase-like glycosyltransferase